MTRNSVVFAQRLLESILLASDAPTLRRLVDGYISTCRARKKRSADEIARALGIACREIGEDRPANEIEPADISDYLGQVYMRGSPVAAVRSRAYLSAAFGWALKSTYDYTIRNRMDFRLRSNPVAAVPKDNSASRPRDRVLSVDELVRLWWAVDGPGFAPETACAIRLLICCGQRVRETLRLERCDLRGDLWVMPAHKSKIGRPHKVPLGSLALEVLARHGDRFTITDHAINRAIARWNPGEHFQTRDLRRTWKTLTHEAGVSRFMRDLLQQHARVDTGGRYYDRNEYEQDKRHAIDLWDSWLRQQLTGSR